ncbi:MAG TPA: tetratricopeptide repeat protein [Blastocatellia bacterium]|nr:tetratricopeptide repeat protein [Blastocatellia bacterium]
MNYADRQFIGRKQELATLEGWLQRSGNPKWFVVVTGSGGIGKSQLIENFASAKRLDQRSNTVATQLIDLYWTAHQTEVGILRNLASQLGGQSSFPSFYNLLREPDRDVSDEVRGAFSEEFKQLRHDKILLVFDTLEKAGGSSIRFLTQTAPKLKALNQALYILAAGRDIPAELAGSDFIEELILSGLRAQDFSHYFAQTVRGRTVPEETTLHVHEVAGGRPIWAGLFADWTNDGNYPTSIDTSSFESFREQVLQPVVDLREPEDTLILAMAHLSRRCNERLLSQVLSDVTDDLGIDIPEQIKRLSRFSFVKYREPVGGDLGSCLLHDEMRDLVHDHLWRILDPSGLQRKGWSSRAITFYDCEIERVESTSPPSIVDIQELLAERLYYLFHVNSEEAFEEYTRLFESAISADFQESLNEEVVTAQKAFDVELSPWLNRRYLLNQAIVDHRRERYAEAIEKYRRLSEDPDCEIELLAQARWRWVMACNVIGKSEEGIDRGGEWKTWLESEIDKISGDDASCKALNVQLASLYSQLGEAYRTQGDATEAVKHYKQALVLYGRFGAPRDLVANTRTNLSGAYLQLGEWEKALEQCRASYAIYSAIGDPYHIGRVHSVWGLIHEGILQEDAALERYKLALQCFQEARNKRGQGMAQLQQAIMLRKQSRSQYGLTDSNAESKGYLRAKELIEAAITNFEGLNPSLMVSALREKGTLLGGLGIYDESVQFLNESVELARNIYHKYQIADSLQALARVYRLKGELDKAIACAEESISQGFPRSSMRARTTIADIDVERKDYDGAFKQILLSCPEVVQMDTGNRGDTPARRDQAYEEWIKSVKGLLLKLPTAKERKDRTRQLIDHWNGIIIDGESLGDAHPHFVSELETLELENPKVNLNARGSNHQALN